jgi:3-deoxy-D-manno-octulosonate 8-phosphate phosphatase (KDO 8-P phosphatase)
MATARSPVAERSPKTTDRPPLTVLARLELMVFDVDGVLPDGTLYYGPQGEVLKVFHVLDGAGLKALAAAGVATAVITGRESPMVLARCTELGIHRVAQGVEDKLAEFEAMRDELGITEDVCGYMGDDEIDIPVMRRVGFAATVPGAADCVFPHAHWVSRRTGGHGAVRELCDLIVAARRARLAGGGDA